MTRCSIIIPAYNEDRVLTECVVAAAADAGPADEILVGDDGSTDDTAARAEQLADVIDAVRVYSWADNQGILETNQRLAERARGRYLLRIDADSRLRPGTVGGVCDELDGGASVVYGNVAVANTRYLHPASCQVGKERGRADWHGGACLGVHRQAFLDGGGFTGQRQNVERELMYKTEGPVVRLEGCGIDSYFPVAWRDWLPRKYQSGRVYLRECMDTPERFTIREVRGPVFWALTALVLVVLPVAGLVVLGGVVGHYARDAPAIYDVSGRWAVALAYPAYQLLAGVARAAGVWTRPLTLARLVWRRYA